MSKEIRKLPFFPLSVFLFPGEDIPLRIFEPRYLQLIDDAKKEGFTFVIPYVKESDIQDIGCEVKLQEVIAETPQGRKVISVESVSLVSILSFEEQIDTKLYSGGKVQSLPPCEKITDPILFELVVDYVEHYDSSFLSSYKGSDLSLHDIMAALNLSSEDKFSFMKISGTQLRQRFLIKQLQYLKMIKKQEKMLDDDFRLN